jgi:hypothetical protein
MHDRLVSLREALINFIDASETQSQLHIKLLHWHIVERLVIEGGFDPDDIVPHPPLRIETAGSGGRRRHRLIHDPSAAVAGELTILGGLKTKDVDVVVSRRGIGPCIAISVKGTLNAFRNLTNRMEEAAGDCTNIHISYPNLVYGFFHVIRAGRFGEVDKRNDAAIEADGRVVDGIVRYHDAIARLTGRKDVRNDVSRYEAVCLLLASTEESTRGTVLESFPTADSTIRFDRFFNSIYDAYDLRYVYTAPALRKTTARLMWATDSPAFDAEGAEGFNRRIADA